MTTVVHCRREPFDVLIDRTTKWGNPFSHLEVSRAEYQVASREEAVCRYRPYIMGRLDLLRCLDELRDKALGCWCHPKACHGHILADLADMAPFELRIAIAQHRGFQNIHLSPTANADPFTGLCGILDGVLTPVPDFLSER